MIVLAQRQEHRTAQLAAALRRIAGSALAGRPQQGAYPDGGQQSWTPLLIANAVIAMGFAAAASDELPPVSLLVWTCAAIATSLLPMVLRPIFAHHLVARLRETWAALLGLVWAMLPVLFFDIAGHNLRVLAIALVFAVSSIGSLALSASPRAAIVFRGMITVSLVLCAVKLGGHAGLALGLLAIFASTAATCMILRGHDAAVQRAAIEREVQKKNEIIALLLNDFSDQNRDWLWETGHDGRLTYASPGLFAGLGCDATAVIGQPLDHVLKASGDAPGWHELQTAILRRKPIDCITVELPFASGKTWWQITARPLFAGDGAFLGYRGAAHDVTAGHHSNEKLLLEKEAAERSSATKSQFLAVMSHELRTPLNAIVGFAEFLGSPQAEHLGPEDRADHLRTIRESSKHLQNLINDILDAARIEKGTMKLVEQETDAAELVEVAVKMCREAAERSDTTLVARIVDGVEIRGDMTRIKQVLINLITNALKFSPAGSFVNVSFERRDDGGLAIAVRDDGLGIRKEDLLRIFEPYVQADEGIARRFGGAGLGLAIAKRIATLHGGEIEIASEYGNGTTARLVLPAWRVSWPALQPAAAKAA